MHENQCLKRSPKAEKVSATINFLNWWRWTTIKDMADPMSCAKTLKIPERLIVRAVNGTLLTYKPTKLLLKASTLFWWDPVRKIGQKGRWRYCILTNIRRFWIKDSLVHCKCLQLNYRKAKRLLSVPSKSKYVWLESACFAGSSKAC